MRRSIWLLVVLTLVFTGCMRRTTNQEPVRTWMTTDGETMKARWDRTDDSNPGVIRLISNGKNYDIDVKDLSKKDQQYIQQTRQKKFSKFRPAQTLSTGNEGSSEKDELKVKVQPPTTGSKAGEQMVRTVDGIEYAFRWCPPGKFTMGSEKKEKKREDNETQHDVTLTKGFWMLETEVTQAMWQSVMGDNPSYIKGDDWPVENVNWNDCQEFCRKLSGKIGMQVTLPTEAQWEYACRAGTTTAFCWGDDESNLFKYGNYCDRSNTDDRDWQDRFHNDGYDKTAPVRSYKPNSWGLYDMHGNVWEWCQDGYASYPYGSVTDPIGTSNDSFYVNRGGCWSLDAGFCRSASRLGNSGSSSSSRLGFRIVGCPDQ